MTLLKAAMNMPKASGKSRPDDDCGGENG